MLLTEISAFYYCSLYSSSNSQLANDHLGYNVKLSIIWNVYSLLMLRRYLSVLVDTLYMYT